jgi:hypothetical protein
MAGSSPAARAWSSSGMARHALTAPAFAQRLAFGIADCSSAALVPGGGRDGNWGRCAKPDEHGVARLKPRDATAERAIGFMLRPQRRPYHNYPQGVEVIPDEYAALRNGVCDRIARG